MKDSKPRFDSKVYELFKSIRQAFCISTSLTKKRKKKNAMECLSLLRWKRILNDHVAPVREKTALLPYPVSSSQRRHKSILFNFSFPSRSRKLNFTSINCSLLFWSIDVVITACDTHALWQVLHLSSIPGTRAPQRNATALFLEYDFPTSGNIRVYKKRSQKTSMQHNIQQPKRKSLN